MNFDFKRKVTSDLQYSISHCLCKEVLMNQWLSPVINILHRSTAPHPHHPYICCWSSVPSAHLNMRQIPKRPTTAMKTYELSDFLNLCTFFVCTVITLHPILRCVKCYCPPNLFNLIYILWSCLALLQPDSWHRAVIRAYI